jgi:putative hydrolase of the HAD superfamily
MCSGTSCRTGPQLPSERVGILSRVRFRAVFFDAGETLVHPDPSFPELFARIVTNEGYPREPVAISEGLAMVTDEFRRASDENALWTTTPERSRRFWLGVYDRFLEVLDLPRDDGLADTLYTAFTDRTNYASFDDVRAALTALRDAGVRLGVISNYEAWLEDLLRDLELTSLLSVRVVSGVEGVEKPDPAIFHLALERIGLPAGDVVYVGDVPDFDIEPAAAVGMFPVLIDRRGRYPDFAGPLVRDLRELPALLEVS